MGTVTQTETLGTYIQKLERRIKTLETVPQPIAPQNYIVLIDSANVKWKVTVTTGGALTTALF